MQGINLIQKNEITYEQLKSEPYLVELDEVGFQEIVKHSARRS